MLREKGLNAFANEKYRPKSACAVRAGWHGSTLFALLICLTPFSTLFQLYCDGQYIYPCFPRVLLTSTPHSVLPKPLAAFPHNHCRNNATNSDARMNPVAIPIINLRKEYRQSRRFKKVYHAIDWTIKESFYFMIYCLAYWTPAGVAQWWTCLTHDVVVVSLIPRWDELLVSFRRILASHLWNMWEKQSVFWERKLC